MGDATDISEDFFLDDIVIRIPTFAEFLFVAPQDTHYSDNTDPDNDFKVIITASPESLSGSILGFGELMVKRRNRN